MVVPFFAAVALSCSLCDVDRGVYDMCEDGDDERGHLMKAAPVLRFTGVGVAGVALIAATSCLDTGVNTLTGVTMQPDACNGPGGGFLGCSMRDSVTFTFYGSLPAVTTAVNSATVPVGPSGKAPHVDGQRFITVTLRSAQAHDQQGVSTTQGAVYAAGMHRIAETALVEDFEGTVRYVIGVNGTGTPGIMSARGAHTFYVIVS